MKTVKANKISLGTEMKQSFFYVLLFASFFMVFGYYFPKIYYEYFDTRTYYDVRVPFETDKPVYNPCGKVKQTVSRNAVTEIDGVATIELVLINETGNEEVYRERQVFSTEQTDGYETVYVTFVLPCQLENGLYRYEGIITYEVNDKTHKLPVYSKDFLVEATRSAKLTD
jgi:hypothetical protein